MPVHPESCNIFRGWANERAWICRRSRLVPVTHQTRSRQPEATLPEEESTMSDTNRQRPWIIPCSKCSQSMSVAIEHVNLVVTCPHCAQSLEPWRILSEARRRENARGFDVDSAGYPTHSMISSRNKVIAGLLGIFLGGLGAHRFYLGYFGIGMLQLILSFATCGIATFWGFIEGILCLAGQMRDVDGLPLSD